MSGSPHLLQYNEAYQRSLFALQESKETLTHTKIRPQKPQNRHRPLRRPLHPRKPPSRSQYLRAPPPDTDTPQYLKEDVDENGNVKDGVEGGKPFDLLPKDVAARHEKERNAIANGGVVEETHAENAPDTNDDDVD